MLSGHQNPLPPQSLMGGQIEKGVPGIWGALQLLVLYHFFLGFHSRVKCLGSGGGLCLVLQHRGQGLLLLERKGLISAFTLEGERREVCTCAMQKGTEEGAMNDPAELLWEPGTQPLDLLLGVQSPVFFEVLSHTHLGGPASPLGVERTPTIFFWEGALRLPSQI